MNEIEKIFMQDDNRFTLFVVEQRFVVGRGYEYFHPYLNTYHIIDSDEQIKKIFSKAIETIGKNVAPLEKLVKIILSGFSGMNIAEAITSLCKLYTVNEHQLAGPGVIDPIILQEGKISKKAIAHIVSINKDSILRPTIIVLLQDNDFERAKKLLSECPDGINVKMVWNSGKEENYKVINCGTDNIVSFIDSFSKQCFSTCSKTNREILLNREWSENSLVKTYSPRLFKYRSSLLVDQKDIIREELYDFIAEISSLHSSNSDDEKIIRSFECISKLFKVFCNDYGGTDIVDAAQIAKDINHELLLAHVYRYAEFLPNCSLTEKLELYQKGYHIFRKNSMEDHAIYCKNNMLVEQFYSNHVVPEEFREMQIEAVNNVPGMVGLSHIFNNVGVAYLYCGQASIAIDFFNRGLEYAHNQDRLVQYLALESNKMIAECYSFCKIEDTRIRFLLRRIFDGMGTKQLPFLAADYVLNVLAVAYRQNIDFGYELIHVYPILQLFQVAFDKSIINAGERLLQMQYLSTKYGDKFPLLKECTLPKAHNKPCGKRMEFILNYGLNPFDFETWL